MPGYEFRLPSYPSTAFPSLTTAHVGSIARDRTLGGIRMYTGTSTNWTHLGGEVVNITDPVFGAVGDGVTDDTAAISAAVDAGSAIYAPPGTYVYSAVKTLNKPIAIVGSGRKTIFQPSATYNGYLFEVAEGSDLNAEGQMYGITLQDFAIVGDRTNAARGIHLSHLDHSVLRNLWLENLRGTALRLSNPVRECLFDGVFVRSCGDAAALLPSVDLENTDVVEDSINMNEFWGLSVIYPYYIGMLVRGTASTSSDPPRYNFFHQSLFHGLLPSAAVFDVIQVQNARGGGFFDCYMTQQGLNRALLQLGNDAGTATVADLVLAGNRIADYNSADANSGGYGVRVRAGSNLISGGGNVIINHRTRAVQIDSTIRSLFASSDLINQTADGDGVAGTTTNSRGGFWYADVNANNQNALNLKQVFSIGDAADAPFQRRRSADTNQRVILWEDKLEFGSGSTTPDVTLSRSTNNELLLGDGDNLAVGTTSGTKIGTSTAQKLGFWNATPITQPSSYTTAAITTNRVWPTTASISTDAGGAQFTSRADFEAFVQVVHQMYLDLRNTGLLK